MYAYCLSVFTVNNVSDRLSYGRRHGEVHTRVQEEVNRVVKCAPKRHSEVQKGWSTFNTIHAFWFRILFHCPH